MSVQMRQLALLLFWTAFCFGLTLSPALISIGQAGIAFLGILSLKNITLSKNDKTLSLLFIIYYAIGALSILYSDNTDEAIRKLILKLPILLFPLLLITFKNLKSLYPYIILIFAYAIYLPAFISVFNYLRNKQLYDILILESKPLPIEFGYGIYHIQFSILLAISILLCIDYIYRHINEKKDWIWLSLLFIGVANLIFIHLLSARTGLLALYLGGFFYMVYALRKKGSKFILAGFIASLVLFALMFTLSSSLKNRLENSVKDLKVVWNNTDPNDYSFALRVQAWKNAIDIIKVEPWGVGIGDAEKVLFDNFEKTNPNITKDNRKNPHFQLLETAVQSGWFSIVIFISILLFLIIVYKDNHLLIGITILLYTASCFESILESQASVAAFGVFLAFSAAYFDNKLKSKATL